MDLLVLGPTTPGTDVGTSEKTSTTDESEKETDSSKEVKPQEISFKELLKKSIRIILCENTETANELLKELKNTIGPEKYEEFIKVCEEITEEVDEIQRLNKFLKRFES